MEHSARNDILFAGFLWVAAAAFAGTFRLGGNESLAETHDWLSQVARAGDVLHGARRAGESLWPVGRVALVGTALSIAGAGVVHAFAGSPSFGTVSTLLGSTILLALLLLAFLAVAKVERARRSRHGRMALLIIAAFAVGKIPLAADGVLRPVDVLHLFLMSCYAAIWIAVRDMTKMEAA